MRLCLVTLYFVVATTASAQEGWVSLFDGNSLQGWKAVDDELGGFEVADGVLAAGKCKMNHLFYVGPVKNGRFKNFELKAEVKTTPGSNSGIFFHTAPKTGTLSKGYEAQINSTHKDKRKTGSLFDVVDVFETQTKDNEWFTYHIIVKDKRIVLRVNDKTVVDYTEPEHPKRSKRRKERLLSSGAIALQGHDPDSMVYFRDIRIKPLD